MRLLALLALSSCLGSSLASEQRPVQITAPDFPPGLQWLNVTRALSLADLQGRIVILDFWTYGCINCIHVMEELKRLQHKYGNRLVVVGVHTPKFDNEQNLENLRNVLRRYDRHEPVVNDPGYRMMQSYGVRAWPTLVLLDPYGNYVGKVSGEGHETALAQVIDQLLQIHAEKVIDAPLDLLKPPVANRLTDLAAPEKIALGVDRIAISDSRLHQLLITDTDGTLIHRLGGPTAGFRDGNADTARFDAPRGLAFDANGSLYVADTGNHALRRIDFDPVTVTTIAGTGEKSPVLSVSDSQEPRKIALRSPWGLALNGSDLYIAMAGDHRIWRLNLQSKRLQPFAGSGREGIDDGPPDQATFSQPSGLALLGDQLYVADAEDSAIRRINLGSGRVETLVGSGLHDFGDRDGPLASAMLQHPQGIAAWKERKLLVADTYNHRIKLIDLDKGSIRSLFGNGKPGLLNEPGGLAVKADRVWITDTNNRRVIRLDLDNGQAHAWTIRDGWQTGPEETLHPRPSR